MRCSVRGCHAGLLSCHSPSQSAQPTEGYKHVLARALPCHAQLQTQVPPPVPIEEKAFSAAVEIEVAQDLDVLAAVLLHQVETPLAHPLQGLQAVGRLGRPESLLREVAHADTETE